MMFDEDEFYTKVVVLDEIYNFAVNNFIIWEYFSYQIYNIRFKN